jgi:4-hydroxybenzoate polyprenyltransferase
MQTIVDYFQTIRLYQWIKNLFLFAPLIFALKFTDKQSIFCSVIGFFSFCFISSAGYIVNDIIDRNKDVHHPVKKNRPIARGSISPVAAIILSIVLTILSTVTALGLPSPFIFVLFSFLVVNITYSLYFKHLVILDVMAIAAGFVLRVVAGAVAIHVSTSNWIILSTLFITLFLGFGKRRNELNLLSDAIKHRPVLAFYSNKLLDSMLSISAALAVITYSLYVVDKEIIARLHTSNLVYTVPFVVYGILKYLFVIYNLHKGGDPADVLMHDKSIITAIVLWGLSVLVILCVSNGIVKF